MSARIYPFPKPFKNRQIPLSFDGKEEFIDQLVGECSQMIFEKMKQYSINFHEANKENAAYNGTLVAEAIRSMALDALHMNHILQPVAKEMFKKE